ncbi:vacuolar protein sorting 53 [Verticillium alfalfae VaMs.102]|uniref:Vacuolar protein sorting 53 n=1 Tax=Verticillium alfalfae (strain VaMs.102 / ATCC MYA-4576 / FGSC 10136) TaxID=526221 RepID=C9SQF3_VERA1|nr:vacuolar protein sorting 53 [Verticillium alfalfae VaMs.102]EEY21078.1 vacuolar protein sorting 53 [Verticillium alfalfae VaMs.102]
MNGVALDDPTSLDAVDYDPIDHLNLLFSHPSTVTSISRVSQTLHEHKNDVSTDIAELELAQAYGPDSSLERMQSAQAELAQLFRKIETVRSRAIETEQNITSMTADIKRLDGTKRNLTLSMTALKRLQMLTTAYEQLQGHARTRQYRECASLLQAVLQLMKHFNSYRSIEQIATLSRGVSELQRTLLEQVCEDFELAFAKDEVSARRGTLVEACHVMDALGDAARSRLMTCTAAIFPPHWRANEMLAAAFCDGTREDFKGILERSMRRTEGPKLDVNLLLSCLQETLDFEHGLERRFADGPRASIDTLSSADDRASNFHGSISAAFEPYLSLWVESQDRQLAAMIPKYRSQPLLPDDEEFTPQAVIPSAIELFHFYKLTLSQCAKLSTSDRLLDLAKTLAKYLDEYAQQVLLHFLSRGGAQGPPLQDIVMVMNTADFWSTNANQLEENIRKRIDPELRDRVDLSSQADAFLGVASAAVLALVRSVEHECAGAWREMRNTNWGAMESVGDQSSYVGELLRAVNGRAEAILELVVKQQYARAFCDNLMLLDKYVMTKAFEGLLSFHNKAGEAQAPPASFVKRVAHTMNRIDPLLKTLQVRPSPPEGLVQAYLIHIADRSDVNFKKILDLKAVRKQDQAHLLELFGIHRDSKANDGKLAQNSPLLTPLLASQSMSGGGGGGGHGSIGGAGAVAGVAGASINTASSALSAAGSSATAMAGLQGKFDATSLGEKLLSAARDLGQGGVVGEKGGGGSGVVAAEKAMNENLKNFGKFFRRDLGGFGARFGKRDGADEGQR